ncbi:MAG: type VI secretion system contractile sheath small subunit [Nitrospirota bacterium]|jgi:type VI secretion system protein ImpB
MAKEGSVAPKERVNITYKPATGGAQEEVELPLKFMMLGDYTLRADDTPLEERKAIQVDKDNFNDVMRSQKLELDANVEDRLSGVAGDQLAVHLKFDTLADFNPESVARQVPELDQLLQLRNALTALKGPLGNLPAFRKKIESILADETKRAELLKELGPSGEGGEKA